VIEIEAKELVRRVKNKSVVIIFAPKYNVGNLALELAKELSALGHVFYMSCSKTCRHVINTLAQKGADTDKIRVIDGITKTIIPVPSEKDCGFLSAPYRFDELMDTIKEFSKTILPDFFIFDALSTVSIYYGYTVSREIGITVKLVNLIQLINEKCKIVFLCSNESKDDPLVQEVLTVVDEVIET